MPHQKRALGFLIYVHTHTILYILAYSDDANLSLGAGLGLIIAAQ